MSKSKEYQARIEQQHADASAIRLVCVNSQTQLGSAADLETRMTAIAAAATASPMFESLGEHAGGVACAWASAIQEYAETYGAMPSDALLSSAAQSLRNITMFESVGAETPMLESVQKSLTTSQGVEIRARQAGLILPVLLAAATSDAVTHIPGAANETEIFRIRRHAGSTFGDYEKGDELGIFAHGQYSQMNQTYPFAAGQVPDGEKTSFVYNSATDGAAIKVPFKRHSVKILVNRRRGAVELEEEGRMFGVVKINNSEINLSADIDYPNGKVTLTTSAPLPAGVKLYLVYDVDIEQAPELIPTITHKITSVKLRPHEAVIAAEHTIQAFWTMQREYGLDLRSMQMSHMRNYLAYEKDLKNLKEMIKAHQARETFDLTVPGAQYFKEHYEMLGKKLTMISNDLMERTKVSGLVGMFAGKSATAVFKSLGAPHFILADNYRQVPRIHYVGTLFGTKVFEVPTEIEVIKGDPETKLGEWDCMCYARGENHTEAGIVTGDAIPATMYSHGTQSNMRDRNTLWELSYCDVHPDAGEEYFTMLTLIPAAESKAVEAQAKQAEEQASE